MTDMNIINIHRGVIYYSANFIRTCTDIFICTYVYFPFFLMQDLEEFIQSYNSLMQHYWSLERDIVAEVMANEVEGIERLLSHHTSVLQEIKAAPKYVHKTGTDLLISIEKDQEKGGVSSMTPEKINATAVIRNILDRVARKEHQLEDVWRHKKVLLDQNLQYRVFDNAVAKISSWLKGKGLEMVADRQEVGVCVQTSQEILRHLKGMEAKSKVRTYVHDKPQIEHFSLKLVYDFGMQYCNII